MPEPPLRVTANVTASRKSGITLATNCVRSRGQYAGLLHLLDGPASLDGVVLALVADEDDPATPDLSRLAEQGIHLAASRAGSTHR